MNSILFKDSFPWTNFTQFKKTISYFYCSCSQNDPFIYCNNICKACLFGKTGQITYITLDIVLTHRYITITHRLLYINHKYCVSDEYISTSAFHKHIFLPHDSHLNQSCGKWCANAASEAVLPVPSRSSVPAFHPASTGCAWRSEHTSKPLVEHVF